MVDRRDLGSWMSGPGSETGGDDTWPGRRLGRARSGPGSVARPGRRLVAVAVDWLVATLISRAFLDGDPWATLAVFTVEQVLLVGTLGAGIGHVLLGLRVERLEGGLPGPVKGLVRSVLLALAVPALIWDSDQRGLHDRAAGTVLLRR